jgi:hypothetical protein
VTSPEGEAPVTVAETCSVGFGAVPGSNTKSTFARLDVRSVRSGFASHPAVGCVPRAGIGLSAVLSEGSAVTVAGEVHVTVAPAGKWCVEPSSSTTTTLRGIASPATAWSDAFDPADVLTMRSWDEPEELLLQPPARAAKARVVMMTRCVSMPRPNPAGRPEDPGRAGNEGLSGGCARLINGANEYENHLRVKDGRGMKAGHAIVLGGKIVSLLTACAS